MDPKLEEEKIYRCPLCGDFETKVKEFFLYHLETAYEDGGCSFTCSCNRCQKEAYEPK